MDDLISRQAAIDAIKELCLHYTPTKSVLHPHMDFVIEELTNLPSAQPTLYGYKIEHLAFIARVMEKEGVTADYAVRTFDNMSRVIKMIIEEAQQKVEEALNGRFD